MRVLSFVTYLLSLSLLAGCQLQHNSRPNIILIAVDSLGVNDINCADAADTGRLGFAILCGESVRFTHAFTPSVLSQPALGSILTGQYPMDIKLSHNGSQGLVPEVETLAERAISVGYRTSFISGGAPIFRKSGFHQGFEIFDDSLTPELNRIYRPVDQNFHSLTSWVEGLGGDPFLSFVYVPDLLFLNADTTTDLGELRNRSLESQLDELDESLYYLIDNLKKQNLWDQSYFILVGLNGRAHVHRTRELSGFNLYSENTQVALFVKPSRKKGDVASNWKIDHNVNLVDLGFTLHDLAGVELPAKNKLLPSYSLKEALHTTEVSWPEDRILLTESGWADWHQLGNSRYSIRLGHWLIIYDQNIKIYNTLADRLEVTPLNIKDFNVQNLLKMSEPIKNQYQIDPWSSVDNSLLDKFYLAFLQWTGLPVRNDLYNDLQRLARRRPLDSQLQGWLANMAVQRQNWPGLLEIATNYKNNNWQFVAQRNLKSKKIIPPDDCLGLLTFKSIERDQLKSCEDPIFLEFMEWQYLAKTSEKKEVARERFLRSYMTYLVDQRVAENNYAAGLIWDVSIQRPTGPHLVELAMALPKFQKVQAFVKRRIGN